MYEGSRRGKRTLGTLLTETLENIIEMDHAAEKKARDRWNHIAKPLHSLGLLEEQIVQIAGIRQNPFPSIDRRILVVFCSDNGVVREGVTQTGQETTALVARNFLRGKTTACIMCQRAGIDVIPYDFGISVDTDVSMQYKIACGTENMAEKPAMTREQAEIAIENGIRIAAECHEKGYDLATAGEMGIGNTTTSTAVICALLSKAPEEMTGRGAGLSSEGLKRKIRVIQKALDTLQPDPADPLDVVSKTGGFDIAGMAGFYLGCARYHLPVILDGFISNAAALTAVRLCPAVNDYLIASHCSAEKAAKTVLHALGKTPPVQAGICVGEGCGAAALVPLLDMALDVYKKMYTFDDIAMESYKEQDMEDG